MRPLIVALIFALIFLSSCYLAAKGYRGVATSRSEGYGEYLPDHMLADPERQLHLLVLILLAVYGPAVTFIAGYPVEKMKSHRTE